jgi:hypothetical protein
MAVSDPRSPRYGQHLSIDDITTLVGPPRAHADTVCAFLAAHGVPVARIHVGRNGYVRRWLINVMTHPMDSWH